MAEKKSKSNSRTSKHEHIRIYAEGLKLKKYDPSKGDEPQTKPRTKLFFILGVLEGFMRLLSFIFAFAIVVFLICFVMFFISCSNGGMWT
jgi:hypothetical protein